MSGIYLHYSPGEAALKSYTSSTKGAKSTLRIEVEVLDPTALGWLLRQLGEIKAEQTAEAKRNRAPARQSARTSLIEAPLLALPAPSRRLIGRASDHD